MKRKSILIVISIITLIIKGPASAKEKEILFGYQNTANSPYEIGYGEKIPRDNPGIAIDMVKKASEKTGITPSFIRLPWKRAIMMVSSGEIDALVSASYNKERGKAAVYPMQHDEEDSNKKIYTGRYVFFQNKKAPLGWNGEKFHAGIHEIHIPLGYSVANDLKGKNAEIVEKPDIKHSFYLLQKRRIDGIAELETAGQYILRKMASDLTDIEQVAPIIKEKHYYVIFSKTFYANNQKIVEDFWQNISTIRESPEMESILIKYSNPD